MTVDALISKEIEYKNTRSRTRHMEMATSKGMEMKYIVLSKLISTSYIHMYNDNNNYLLLS